MLEAALSARTYLEGISPAELGQDKLRTAATERCMVEIGGAARNISIGFKRQRPGGQWGWFVRYADELTKRYDAVDINLLWKCATQRLPSLIDELEAIIPTLQTNEKEAGLAASNPSQLYGMPFDSHDLARVCRTWGISTLRVFGSALRSDFHADSDVDVLVEFEPGRAPGWKLIDVEDELSTVLKRPVDLGTPAGLSPYIRDRVLQEAVIIYGDR